MFGRSVAVVAALTLVAGCADKPDSGPAASGQGGSSGTGGSTGSRVPGQPVGGFLPPPSSEVLTRALRTDLCALLDEVALAELGWQRGTSQAETLTSCGAASTDQGGTGQGTDQRKSIGVSLDTAVSDRPAPVDGRRCTRLKIVDPVTKIAIKVQVRAEPDPCAIADRFLATAVGRFEAGAGQVQPPDPWIALDACQLLPPLLAVSARTLGGPMQTLREVRRLGPRGCIATHAEGEVTLSVTPAPGRAADLDGAEIAIANRAARVQDLNGICVLRLVGPELGEPGGQQVQVITIEVQAGTDRCTVAAAMGEALAPSLPES